MSDILQPGQQTYQAHPDADQLTAFAEHTLPLHEQQQTLAHLATCADCRQIVFLAQQAVEVEAAESMPVKVRKPWFSGWSLVWPAVVALAGIVAFSVHLRNFSRPSVPTDTVTKAEVARPNPTPAPSPQLPNQGAEPKKKTAAPPVTSTCARAPEVEDAAPAVVAQKPLDNVASPPVAIHGATEGAVQAAVGTTAPAPAPLAFGASNTARLGGVRSVPQQVQGGQAAGKAQLSEDKVATAQGNLAGRAAEPAAQSSQAMPAPPPPPPPPPLSSAKETVNLEASSAAGLPAVSTQNLAKLAPRLALPSHLPAESTASLGAITVSLDAQGKLFLSKDPGANTGSRSRLPGTGAPSRSARPNQRPPQSSF